jgi:hypothetical protein
MGRLGVHPDSYRDPQDPQEYPTDEQGISNEEVKGRSNSVFLYLKNQSKPLPTGKGGWGWAGLPLRTIHILILSKRVDQTNRG